MAGTSHCNGIAESILLVSRNLVAGNPEWIDPDFVRSITAPRMKKEYASVGLVKTWALREERRIYRDRYGHVSMFWIVHPAFESGKWMVKSTLTFAPATSGSFANDRFGEFSDKINISGAVSPAIFGAVSRFLAVAVDDGNPVGSIKSVLDRHEDDLKRAVLFWKDVQGQAKSIGVA